MPSGKLVARFDAQRGILEISRRDEKQTFDLAQLVREVDRIAPSAQEPTLARVPSRPQSEPPPN